VTFSDCIVAEGLDSASHRKGRHSAGALVHDFCREVAFVRCLFANNVVRNPCFKAHTTGVVVNNLIYNPGKSAVLLDYVLQEWEGTPYEPRNASVSVVGNVLVHGPDTRDALAMVHRRGDVYLADNVARDRHGRRVPVTSGNIRRLRRKPCWPEGLAAMPSPRVFEYVLRHAGARPRERDDVDARIVEGVRAGTGRIIDSQDDVGGYPQGEVVRRSLDGPSGNLRQWLNRLALDLE
jgi:hypothetical protein